MDSDEQRSNVVRSRGLLGASQIMKVKAKGRLSAVFEFTERGLLHAIYLSSEDEQDQAILVKGFSHLLKPQKGLLKKIFRKYEIE